MVWRCVFYWLVLSLCKKKQKTLVHEEEIQKFNLNINKVVRLMVEGKSETDLNSDSKR